MFAAWLFCRNLGAQHAVVVTFFPLLYLMNISRMGIYTD
jgi:hypothetical protein